jgi:hypothetical protein
VTPYERIADSCGVTCEGKTFAEADVVFRLAGANPLGDVVDLRAVTDWPRLLQLASDENAVIALRDHLRQGSGRTLPLTFARQLAVLSLDREFRMRVLQQRLEQALAALNAVGIESLLLKGGALANTVYGSFAARPMRDLDLLVRPDRADEARAVLRTMGWRSDPDLPGDPTYETHQHLPPLLDAEQTGLRLEIHRNVIASGHPFHFTDAEIWGSARAIPVGRTTALVMHPTHHAAHIAIHFAWSHMLKLGAWHAFRDLALMDATGYLDWNALVSTAKRWRASTCCYWTLHLAESLAGLSIPEGVLGRLRPRLPESARRALTRHFTNTLVRRGLTCPSTRLEKGLWSIGMQPRRQGHGDVRPWLVSRDLQLALNEQKPAVDHQWRLPALHRVGRSARYVSQLLA